jgi:UPF0755 protein
MPSNLNGNNGRSRDEELPREDERRNTRYPPSRVTPRSPKEALQPDTPPPPPIPASRRHPALSAMSGFLSFLLVMAMASVAGLIWSQHRLHAPGPLTSDKVVYIAPGTEVADIIAALERDEVIDSPFLLNATLFAEGNRSKVKAGEYLFRQNASLRDVIDTLVSGKQVLHSITIPEGLTSAQVVERLKENDILLGDVIDIPKEGSLLPETYKVTRGTLRADVVRKMQEDQKRAVDQIWARRAANLPLRSPYELITLASIVEKETGKADERPRVASVFLNRLRKGMRLQSDPTIVYGLAGGKGTLGRGLTRSEIEKPTPYNTYLIDGLPPGPIANPGRAALEAVASPSRTQDLYFVADGTGGHVFAESLDQHSRNVQRWRQIEKDIQDKSEQPAAGAGETAPPEAPPANPPPVPPADGRRSDRGGKILGYGAAPDRTLGVHQQEMASLPAAVRSPTPAAAAISRAMPAPPPVQGAQLDNGVTRIAGQATAYAFGPGLEQLGLSFDGASAGASALDGPEGSDVWSEAGEEGGLSPDDRERGRRAGAPARSGSSTARFAFAGPAMPQSGASTAQPQAAEHSSAVRPLDSSQGTPRDPLNNKTYDLNYAKTVPVMP